MLTRVSALHQQKKRNDREIEVRVYEDKIVNVRKNNVFGTVNSEEISVDIGKPPRDPKTALLVGKTL
jgi:hypothetical protein